MVCPDFAVVAAWDEAAPDPTVVVETLVAASVDTPIPPGDASALLEVPPAITEADEWDDDGDEEDGCTSVHELAVIAAITATMSQVTCGEQIRLFSMAQPSAARLK